MIKLKDVASYVSEKVDTGLLKAQDYITTDNMLSNRGGIIISNSLPKAEKVTKFERGDILVSNIRPYFKKIWYATFNGGCSNDVIVFRANGINSKFLYYVLSQNVFFDYMMAGANGTKMPRGNKKLIPDFEFLNFSPVQQEHISSILSRFDSLIENNQKQIKLLEEAARRLYKEWFVDLRFPGYKNVEIVKGLPIGWNKCFIDDIFQITYGKTLPTSKISNEGSYPVYGANGIIGYYNEKNCDDYTVLITSRGNGSGDVSRTHDKESFVTNNSFIVKPRNSLYRVSYVYQLMKHTDFKRVCTGSAQPQLTNTSISTIIVNKPAEEVIDLFCNRTDNLYQKIESLLRQNLFLEEARDRLLPKLMSGEIEV